MERRYREAELSPAVQEWLRGLGYVVYAEIHVSLNAIDHVGVRWSDESIICVEMKRCLSWQVLHQAVLHFAITPHVYVAIPGKPMKASLERAEKYGVGVWAAGKVIREPERREWKHTSELMRQRVLTKCRHAIEGGVGGMPTIKGDGPAIRCAAAVREYLKEHPLATWKELWANVPNHYAHARSMRGALGIELPSQKRQKELV